MTNCLIAKLNERRVASDFFKEVLLVLQFYLLLHSSADQAKEQLGRDFKELPKMKIISNPESIFDFDFEDFVLEDYEFHPHIPAPVAV